MSKGNARLLHPPQLGGRSPVSLSRNGQRALYRPKDLYSVREIATGRELGKFGSGDDVAVRSGHENATMTPDGRTLIALKSEKLHFIDLSGGKNREVPKPGL